MHPVQEAAKVAVAKISEEFDIDYMLQLWNLIPKNTNLTYIEFARKLSDMVKPFECDVLDTHLITQHINESDKFFYEEYTPSLREFKEHGIQENDFIDHFTRIG